MTWRGVSDNRRCLRPFIAVEADALLPVGSLVIEAEFASQKAAQPLVDMAGQQDWPFRFAMHLHRDGSLMVHHGQGIALTELCAQLPQPDHGATLRVTLSWHAPERLGILTLENLSTNETVQKVFRNPLPWAERDLARLIASPRECGVGDTVQGLAVSDDMAAVGISGGFARGTLVDTQYGPRAIETLEPGDQVQTSEHGQQPVLQVISYEVPAVGSCAPLTLTAPFHGLIRDLTISPNHQVLVEGADAEYLFGSDAVLVSAGYLARGSGNASPPRAATIRYYQVLLEAHVCLSIGGMWGESLFVGDLVDQPARLATSPLAAIPRCDLPRHQSTVGPQLKGYEAIVLVSALFD
ncbi:Type I secretion target repeat protein [Candidatus Rhodobacter oscarellae]|uniref:Type I secretion target repeat protein n=1 Tax=Candidatus Rhodobacter oscarellae TaxID=1675527 RepID=A0A0J9H4Y7_9RHOB|nr:Hint domain-containing protein [Candidatus Rhodobacter lobularis]KMW60633.1 Type I secretion target repeat protein [Candidatus Rhodobacter lobularis]